MLIFHNFFKALKAAYNQINKDKQNAKACRKSVREINKKYRLIHNKLVDIFYYLRDVRNYLPAQDYKEYIQKTSDLIHKGFDNKNGLIDLYKLIIDIFDRSAERMDILYKEKKYYAVRKTYEDTIKEVTQYLNKYGIDYMPNYLMFNSDAKIGEVTNANN